MCSILGYAARRPNEYGSIAVREIDTVTLKDWMGHAKLTTTECYLHAKPRHDDAARIDRAFSR